MHPTVYWAYAGCGDDVCCIFSFCLCVCFHRPCYSQVHASVHESFHCGKLCISQAAGTLSVCTSLHAISAAVYENGCVYSYVVNVRGHGYVFSSLNSV